MHPQQNPYDFIMNSGQPSKPAKMPGGNSMASRILVVVAGLGVLVMLLIVGASIIGGGGSGRESLLSVAQTQQETIRVATMIARESSNQVIKNSALSAQLTVSSDKSQFTTLLAERGITFKEDELLLSINPETDSRLETAQSGGLYETAALETLTDHMQTYQASLGAAYDATSNEDIKKLLSEDFESAKLLLEQLETTQL